MKNKSSVIKFSFRKRKKVIVNKITEAETECSRCLVWKHAGEMDGCDLDEREYTRF